MPAVAITDHGNLYGAIEFYLAAQRAGIRPIIGCEAYVAPNPCERNASTGKEAAFHLTLLATDADRPQSGQTYHRGAPGGLLLQAAHDKDLLASHSGGLIALSGCLKGEINSKLLSGDAAGAKRVAASIATCWAEKISSSSCTITVSRQSGAAIRGWCESHELDLDLVAANDVHFSSVSITKPMT